MEVRREAIDSGASDRAHVHEVLGGPRMVWIERGAPAVFLSGKCIEPGDEIFPGPWMGYAAGAAFERVLMGLMLHINRCDN